MIQFLILNFKMTKNKKAFTMVEALIALSILTIGILSSFILVSKALYNVTIIKDRLTASFLAQEGIELVRQIRDTNMLKRLDNETVRWDEGLKEGKYIIDSGVLNGEPIKLILVTSEEAPNLKYDNISRIYNYDAGEETSFNRVIQIIKISEDELRIECLLKWKSKDVDFDLTVEDHLFNWLKI